MHLTYTLTAAGLKELPMRIAFEVDEEQARALLRLLRRVSPEDFLWSDELRPYNAASEKLRVELRQALAIDAPHWELGAPEVVIE